MTKAELLKIIENKRNELIQIVIKNGFNSVVTLKFSQELDVLLNEYDNT